MKTITLPDGTKEHTLPKWIGIQKPNEPMVKTKWRRTDMEYHNDNTIIYFTCTCKGYTEKCDILRSMS